MPTKTKKEELEIFREIFLNSLKIHSSFPDPRIGHIMSLFDTARRKFENGNKIVENDIGKMKTLYKEGFSTQEISRILDTSRKTVKKKLIRAGIWEYDRRDKINKDKREYYEDMISSMNSRGFSTKKISEELGLSSGHVRRLKRNMRKEGRNGNTRG